MKDALKDLLAPNDAMAQHIAKSFDRLFPSTEGIPCFGERPAPKLCSCGAEIEADEDSCQGCRSEARLEHEAELDRMFPRSEYE